MSLENIQLPDFVIAELYKNSLVELDNSKTEKKIIPLKKEKKTEVEQDIPEQKETMSIKYLGENKKSVSVLVNSSDAVILPDEELLFLTNILKACKLNLGDMAIINVANQSITFTDLQEQLNCKVAILFNVAPRDINLPFSIPHFQVQPFNGCKYLLAPALSELNKGNEDATNLKRSLWECLKKIFEI